MRKRKGTLPLGQARISNSGTLKIEPKISSGTVRMETELTKRYKELLLKLQLVFHPENMALVEFVNRIRNIHPVTGRQSYLIIEDVDGRRHRAYAVSNRCLESQEAFFRSLPLHEIDINRRAALIGKEDRWYIFPEKTI